MLADFLTLKMKALCSFKLSGTIGLATQHNIWALAHLQYHYCNNLSFCIEKLCSVQIESHSKRQLPILSVMQYAAQLIVKSAFSKLFVLSKPIFVPHSGDGCSSKQQSMFEQASIICSIPARWPLHPAYMHTFGITNDYFVIVEQPLSVSVPAVIRSHLLNEPLIANFKWYPDQQVSYRPDHMLFTWAQMHRWGQISCSN